MRAAGGATTCFSSRARGWSRSASTSCRTIFWPRGGSRARTVTRRELAGADISALPFAANSFTAVAAVETFEHIFEPDRALAVREAWRVLASGRSARDLDAELSLDRRNGKARDREGRRPQAPCSRRCAIRRGSVKREDYHPYRYHRPAPRGEIARLLADAGFRVERTRTVIFIWKNVPDRALSSRAIRRIDPRAHAARERARKHARPARAEASLSPGEDVGKAAQERISIKYFSFSRECHG